MQRMKTVGHAGMYSCEDHFHPQTMIRHARQIVDDFSYTISYQSQRMRANACKTVEERWNLLKQTSPAFLRVRLEIVLAESIFSGTKTKFILEKKRKKTYFSRFEWTSARCSPVSAFCRQSCLGVWIVDLEATGLSALDSSCDLDDSAVWKSSI